MSHCNFVILAFSTNVTTKIDLSDNTAFLAMLNETFSIIFKHRESLKFVSIIQIFSLKEMNVKFLNEFLARKFKVYLPQQQHERHI